MKDAYIMLIFAGFKYYSKTLIFCITNGSKERENGTEIVPVEQVSTGGDCSRMITYEILVQVTWMHWQNNAEITMSDDVH